MREYAMQHYHLNHPHLIAPQLIVIHYTAMSTSGHALRLFEQPLISRSRDRLAAHGRVNVGAHFLVDWDGTIYGLLPTTMMARHVIGYNYTAISIENAAREDAGLTDDQVRANAEIINMLLYRHPSITHLIGHLEYMNQTLDHFRLFLAKDPEYEPTIKIDRGFSFMRRLRSHLRQDYGIRLKH